jgi:hypothetical protein
MYAQAAEALRRGSRLTDREFDAMYPKPLRCVSRMQWTPVAVAVRAANLLVSAGAREILDIGSGVGKFCIIGSLSTEHAAFSGIEQRPHLVNVATDVAARLGAGRVRFTSGNAMDVAFEKFDGLYMYNPFYEQVSNCLLQIDETIDRSKKRYWNYVMGVFRKLCRAPLGTKVVTYNGYGARLPRTFKRLLEEPAGADQLVLWSKA